MTERLVDVERQSSKVLHTFPVTITDPIRRSAWRARGDQGGSRPGRSGARLFALGAGRSAGWLRRRLLASSAASTLLRTRLRAVGATRLSGRHSRRALVSDARVLRELKKMN